MKYLRWINLQETGVGVLRTEMEEKVCYLIEQIGLNREHLKAFLPEIYRTMFKLLPYDSPFIEKFES